MDQQLGSLLPSRWVMPQNPAKYDQIVFVNWLNVEVPRQAKSNVVDRLCGWRNREVFWFVRSSDWTARMYGSA